MQTIKDVWNVFSTRFVEIWNAEGLDNFTFSGSVYGTPSNNDTRAAGQALFLKTLLDESLLFAGTCVLRRLVGISHVHDFDSIADADVRGAAELRAFAIGRELLVEHTQFTTIESVVERASCIQAAAR